MKKTKDVLSQKKKELEVLNRKSASAIALVQSTIDGLCDVNEKINETIDDIEEYKASLEETRIGLRDTCARNEKIIQNFKSLLCTE